jgi:hypothetical protein
MSESLNALAEAVASRCHKMPPVPVVTRKVKYVGC